MTEVNALSLGEIKLALDVLVSRGAHPGSIYWVLQNQLGHVCGDCDLCDTRVATL